MRFLDFNAAWVLCACNTRAFIQIPHALPVFEKRLYSILAYTFLLSMASDRHVFGLKMCLNYFAGNPIANAFSSTHIPYLAFHMRSIAPVFCTRFNSTHALVPQALYFHVYDILIPVRHVCSIQNAPLRRLKTTCGTCVHSTSLSLTRFTSCNIVTLKLIRTTSSLAFLFHTCATCFLHHMHVFNSSGSLQS